MEASQRVPHLDNCNFDHLVDNHFHQLYDYHYLVRRLSQPGSFLTQKQAEHAGNDASNLKMKMMMMTIYQ